LVPISWVSGIGSPQEESVVESRTLVTLEPASNPNLTRAISFISQGNYKEAATIILDLYTSSSFVNKFEQATSDQFPWRMPIIQFSKGVERAIIKISYSLLKDPVIPADMTTDLYFDSINNQLLYAPTLYNETVEAQITERIENYKELVHLYPQQNFYIYYHQTLENSAYHPLNQIFSESDQGQAIGYFEDNFPSGITLGKFLLSSIEDHKDYYYRTDHHWNVYGILHAYQGIYSLLSQNYPDISPMLNNKDIIEFADIEFLGLFARRTFYPIEGDDFAVEIVDFPQHTTKINDQISKINYRSDYLEGNYSTVPYTNHYNEFYGLISNLTEYTFENGSERNLLLIGSSYRYALDPLIASHYHKTYCVDLRYLTDFSLSSFLEVHDVDDILIVGDNNVAFEDVEYWKIKP
jgi:hypothetical protein